MSYLREKTCPECGKPHWFRFWVGEFCDRSCNGLYVCDYDLQFHRFKSCRDALGCRDVEHLMKVEVKIGDEKLGAAQRDSLSVLNALMNTMVPVNGGPIGVESRPGFIRPGEKKIVWHGVHLLRVPLKKSRVGPFYWDNKRIDSNTLIKVLNFENDSIETDRPLDIDRRHKAGKTELIPILFADLSKERAA